MCVCVLDIVYDPPDFLRASQYLPFAPVLPEWN